MPIEQLPSRERRMFDRYLLDLVAAISESRRVLRTKGKAVFVVGDSWVRNVFVENTFAVTAAAERAGLRLVSRHERVLPAAHRYLPPPSRVGHASMQRRMRTESVLRFVRD